MCLNKHYVQWRPQERIRADEQQDRKNCIYKHVGFTMDQQRILQEYVLRLALSFVLFFFVFHRNVLNDNFSAKLTKSAQRLVDWSPDPLCCVSLPC